MPRKAKITAATIPVTFRMSPCNKHALILVAEHTNRTLGDVLNRCLWDYAVREHSRLAEQARLASGGYTTP